MVSSHTKEKPDGTKGGMINAFFDAFKTTSSKPQIVHSDQGVEYDRFNGIGELVEAIHHQINYYNSITKPIRQTNALSGTKIWGLDRASKGSIPEFFTACLNFA